MTFFSDAGKVLGDVRQTCSSIKSRVPLLRRLHLEFISLHYAYIIACALVSSIIIFPSSGIDYVDALFLSACAATQSGLNTVNLNSLFTYQQAFLWFISMVTNPIVMHSFVVFVRLYSFEKRFQHLARDARTMRRTRSRSGTVTGSRSVGDLDREERGVGNRRIVVLRNNAGEARGKYIEDVVKPNPDMEMNGDIAAVQKNDSTQSSSQSSSESRGNAPVQDDVQVNDSTQSSSQSSSVSRDKAPVQDDVQEEEPETDEADAADDETVRGEPTKKDNEHISFFINQRSDRGALRIPSPREYDRGGGPQALDDDSNDLSRKPTSQSERPQTGANRDSTLSPGPQQSSGPHITIDEPNFSRSRARASSFPRFSSSRTEDTNNEAQESSLNPLARLRSRKGTLSTLFSAKSREDEDPMPYLSWQPTVGRNSAFVDLTEAQRDELGGIEYRALKTLAVILIGYFVCFHLLGLICLIPWIMKSGRYGAVVDEAGQGRTWWGIFTAGSAFNDVGFTLTPNSMISFQEAIFPLLLMSFLIIIGNTGFPCMLRFIIWVMSILAPKGGVLWEELKFLLDHPRRMFTLLFPRSATWWLFAVLIILNGLDLVLFIVLDLNDPDITAIPPGARVVDGLFQASSTRTAGFSIIDLADLHPGTQVSYLIMMYISVYPIAISMRRTNVYEERSLGVYSVDDDDDEDQESDSSNTKDPSYVGAHLRKQLGFDLWYIALGLFFIAIVEGARLQNKSDSSFTLYSVLFEIISAYGTVGLSLGYPGMNTSFSGQFKPLSKLIIVAMQIRGRHRGLPYKLDRAVLLPSEALHKKELVDAERRMRRRGSNVGSVSTFQGQQRQQRPGQQSNDDDPETATSSGVAPERIPLGALGEGKTAHHRFLGGMMAKLADHTGGSD